MHAAPSNSTALRALTCETERESHATTTTNRKQSSPRGTRAKVLAQKQKTSTYSIQSLFRDNEIKTHVGATLYQLRATFSLRERPLIFAFPAAAKCWQLYRLLFLWNVQRHLAHHLEIWKIWFICANWFKFFVGGRSNFHLHLPLNAYILDHI